MTRKNFTRIIKTVVMVFLSAGFIASSAFTSQGNLDSAVTRDVNGNGYIDRIDLFFTAPVPLSDANSTNVQVKFGFATLPISGVVKVTDYIYQLVIAENQAAQPQTSWQPLLSITGIPSLSDIFNVTCRDGAAPVIWSVTKEIAVPDNRTRDTVIVCFSEKIKNPAGSTFPITNYPAGVFSTWWGETGNMSADSLLAGITNFIKIVGDSILFFSMTNGKNLSADNCISIKASSLILRDGFGNFPSAANRKAVVACKFAEGYKRKLYVFPNSTVPTAQRIQGDSIFGEVLFLGNASLSKMWVLDDRAGVVISTKFLVDDDATPVKISCKIFGNDLFFQPVVSTEYEFLLNQYNQPKSSLVELNYYWNGLDKYGRAIPGIYTAKVKIEQGSDEWESSANILMREPPQGMVWDSLGRSPPHESNCGHGFILAFIPPIGFKLRSLFRRKRTDKIRVKQVV